MAMKIKIKRKLDEISAVGAPGVGGSLEGYGAPLKKKKKVQEMFSSSTQTGGVRKIRISGEKEHAGHVERSKQQGLRNVMEDVEDTLDLNNPDDLGPLDRSIERESEPEEVPEDATQAQIDYKELYEMVLEHGYKLDKTLGAGQYGMVFSAEELKTGGDYVVKVVGYGEALTPISQQEIDRELRNYTTVTQAASTDERMWKHFPETYDTWKESLFDLDLGFIVMEKLVPLNAAESALIPDLNYIIARKKPLDAADVNDYGMSRDQSKKAKLFIMNDMPGIDFEVRNAFSTITQEYDPLSQGNREIDDLGARLNTRVLKRYSRMSEQDPEKLDRIRMRLGQEMLANRGYDMANYFYILTDEITEAPEAEVILLDMMTTLVKLGKIVLREEDSVEGSVKSLVRMAIRDVATAFINGIRKEVSLPIGFSSATMNDPTDSRAGGRDLTQAVQLLYQKTGLLAKDVHDKNVMKREGSGDIVIVDLGLFRLDPKFNQKNKKDDDLSENLTKGREYRIKILTSRKK